MNKRQERALEVFLYVTFAIALVVVGATNSDTKFLSTSIKATMSDDDAVSYAQTMSNFDSYEDLQLLPMISFASNDDKINAIGRKELLKHAEVLRSNPQLILNITGHADSSESGNNTLAESRAMRVYELLVFYGTPAEQLIIDSFDGVYLKENRCVELQYLSTHKTSVSRF